MTTFENRKQHTFGLPTVLTKYENKLVIKRLWTI